MISLGNNQKAKSHLKMFNSVYQVVTEIQASHIWHQSLTIQQDITKNE